MNCSHETFRLARQIDSIVAQIVRSGFGELERVVVLRAVLLAAELDPFRTGWDRLAEETRTDAATRLLPAIEEAREGLLRAVDFLRAEGIQNKRLLPYSMQIVGLAAFFGRRTGAPTEEQKALLRRWLWVSGFTEGFGGLNPSRILLQLKNLREVIPNQDAPTSVDGIDLETPAHPFPERHDHRSARVRALMCVILREHVLGPDGSPITPDKMAADVLQRGPQALARVCAQVQNRGRAPLMSSPANRIFDVTPGNRRQAKTWLLALDPARTDDARILSSHHISVEAWNALNQGDHRAFVEERIETLMDLERRFMREKGVVPPKADRPAPSAIDVEDDVPLSDDAEAS